MTTPQAVWPPMSPELESFIKAADHMKTMNLALTPAPWERQYDEARAALIKSITPVEFDPTPLIPTDR